MHSAIKVNGVRLYKAARVDEAVVRKPREVTVNEFRVWRDDPSSADVQYSVKCTKGTYIRSLVHDLVRTPRLVHIL